MPVSSSPYNFSPPVELAEETVTHEHKDSVETFTGDSKFQELLFLRKQCITLMDQLVDEAGREEVVEEPSCDEYDEIIEKIDSRRGNMIDIFRILSVRNVEGSLDAHSNSARNEFKYFSKKRRAPTFDFSYKVPSQEDYRYYVSHITELSSLRALITSLKRSLKS